MTWKRGLLRLWLIVSLMWLLFAGVSTGFVAAVVGAVSPPPTMAHCNSLPLKQSFNCVGQIDAYNRSPPPDMAVAAHDALLLGVIPSLVLLVIGYSLAWATSGFRASPRDRM